MKKLLLTGLGSSLAILLFSGVGASASAHAGAAIAHHAPRKSAVVKVDKWLSYDAKARTVDLTLMAGVDGGFNFNGYSHGKMVVTAPKGWKVDVTFTNRSSDIPHSAIIVPFAQVKAAGGFTPAFHGSEVADVSGGIMSGTVDHFHFVAAKPGRYGIVCGVPGHDAAGMWDVFVVSPKVKVPSLRV